MDVFIFGSVAEGKEEIGSDIDILIISPNLKDRGKVIAKIWKKIGFFSPFEIHLITPEEYKWYKHFIKHKIEIK